MPIPSVVEERIVGIGQVSDLFYLRPYSSHDVSTSITEENNLENEERDYRSISIGWILGNDWEV